MIGIDKAAHVPRGFAGSTQPGRSSRRSFLISRDDDCVFAEVLGTAPAANLLRLLAEAPPLNLIYGVCRKILRFIAVMDFRTQ